MNLKLKRNLFGKKRSKTEYILLLFICPIVIVVSLARRNVALSRMLLDHLNFWGVLNALKITQIIVIAITAVISMIAAFTVFFSSPNFNIHTSK